MVPPLLRVSTMSSNWNMLYCGFYSVFVYDVSAKLMVLFDFLNIFNLILIMCSINVIFVV
jgi:hypothetical protein